MADGLGEEYSTEVQKIVDEVFKLYSGEAPLGNLWGHARCGGLKSKAKSKVGCLCLTMMTCNSGYWLT
jgi:hypothetical protein